MGFKHGDRVVITVDRFAADVGERGIAGSHGKVLSEPFLFDDQFSGSILPHVKVLFDDASSVLKCAVEDLEREIVEVDE